MSTQRSRLPERSTCTFGERHVFRQELDDALNNLEALKSRYQSLLEDKTSLEQSNDELKDQLANCKRDLEKAEKLVSQLKHQLQEEQDKCNALTVEKEDLDTRLGNSNDLLRAARKDLTEQIRKSTAIEKNARHLEDQLTEARKRPSSELLTAEQSKTRRLSESVSSAQANFERTSKLLSDLQQTRLAEQGAHTARLDEVRAALRKEARKWKEEAVAAKKRIAELEGDKPQAAGHEQCELDKQELTEQFTNELNKLNLQLAQAVQAYSKADALFKTVQKRNQELRNINNRWADLGAIWTESETPITPEQLRAYVVKLIEQARPGPWFEILEEHGIVHDQTLESARKVIREIVEAYVQTTSTMADQTQGSTISIEQLQASWDAIPEGSRRDTMRPDDLATLLTHITNAARGFDVHGDPIQVDVHPTQLAQQLRLAVTNPWADSISQVEALMTRHCPGRGTRLPENVGPPCNHTIVLARALGYPDDTAWDTSLIEVARLMNMNAPAVASPPREIVATGGDSSKIFSLSPPEFTNVNKWKEYRGELEFFCKGNILKPNQARVGLYQILSYWKGDSTGTFAKASNPLALVGDTWEATYEALLAYGDRVFRSSEEWTEAVRRWENLLTRFKPKDYSSAVAFMLKFETCLLQYLGVCRVHSKPEPTEEEKTRKLCQCLPPAVLREAKKFRDDFETANWDRYRDFLGRIWETEDTKMPELPSQANVKMAGTTHGVKRERDDSEDEAVTYKSLAKRPRHDIECRVMKKYDEAPAVPDEFRGRISYNFRKTSAENQEYRKTRERCIKAGRCRRCRRLKSEHTGDFCECTPWTEPGAGTRFGGVKEEDTSDEDDA
jgi:hypothetical protein